MPQLHIHPGVKQRPEMTKSISPLFQTQLVLLGPFLESSHLDGSDKIISQRGFFSFSLRIFQKPCRKMTETSHEVTHWLKYTKVTKKIPKNFDNGAFYYTHVGKL